MPIRLGLTPVFLDNDAAVVDQLRRALEGEIDRPIELIQRRTYQEGCSSKARRMRRGSAVTPMLGIDGTAQGREALHLLLLDGMAPGDPALFAGIAALMRVLEAGR